MLFIYRPTFSFARFRQFRTSNRYKFLVSLMFYLIFYRDKKERFLEITEKEKMVFNPFIVLKYLDIRGIIHFINIY